MTMHYPVPVVVASGDVVGGRAIVQTQDVQLRCGCTDSWEHAWGEGEHR